MLKLCLKCGACFIPQGRDKVCDDCKNEKAEQKVKTAKPFTCEIVEAEGRCQEYLKCECELCLDFCAQQDWIGWRKK